MYHLIVIFGTLVSNDNVSLSFFHFFKMLIFWVVEGGGGGGKRAKNCPEWYSVCCFPYLRNHPTYIVWLSFMVQMCKIIISWGVFFNFKFWFSMWSGGWKGKEWLKMTKLSVCCTLYFRNHLSYDLHLWCACMYKKIISSGIFFTFFQNFDFRDY